MDGMRYHVARFSAKKDVDLQDQNQFLRPISLHRRDPRQPIKGVQEDELMLDPVVDSKEQEKLEIARAEKEAKRAADMAQIAPTGKSASAGAAKKPQSFKHEKTTQVFRLDKTAAEKKESDLKYEEALPWHVEDADNKNVWMGNYEAALSDTNVVFVLENGKFRMIPIEKWYKFSQKNQFKGFSIEEAESQFSKKDKMSRWAMKTQEQQEAENAIQETRKHLRKIFTVKTESASFKNSNKAETQDADDLDFDAGDLFQDDDEMATMEPDNDEDAKDAKERIKREQLAANIFDQAVEDEIDKELQEELEEEEKRKKLGKGVKKALTKREKSTIYESDSENPYASSVCCPLTDQRIPSPRDTNTRYLSLLAC
jgi:transcription initiation factor TFIIF subunit alpha